MGCLTIIQNLARFELRIFQKETAYALRRFRDKPEQPGKLDDILTESYLWVLGAYEIVRTLAQKTKHPRLVQAKKIFERIRIPLAKLEASKANKAIDFNFPYPVILSEAFTVGWAINQNETVLRYTLSRELFNSLGTYCESESEERASPRH